MTLKIERPVWSATASLPAVTGSHGVSLRSGLGKRCNCHKQVRSSGAKWYDTSVFSSSSSSSKIASIRESIPLSTSSRTALPNLRRRSSSSTACKRSSASSSSSSERSAFRVSLKVDAPSIVIPGNNRSRCATMTSSTVMKRVSSTWTNRVKNVGTLMRANRSSLVSGSQTKTPMLRARLETYGKG